MICTEFRLLRKTGKWASHPNFSPVLKASPRLTDRLSLPQATKFGEAVPQSPSHKAVIDASPSFRSFAEFERSPAGAVILQPNAEDTFAPHRGSDGILDALVDKWAMGNRAEAGRSLENPRYWIDKWQMYDDRELKFLKDIADARKRMARVPSGYGELKAVGQQAITGENWAGAIFSQGHYFDPTIVQQALLRGKVPYSRAGTDDPELLFQIARRMQEEAGPARRTPLK